MSKETKENRTLSLRTAEGREQMKRKMRQNKYKSELDFPQEIIPPGMEYAWGSYSVAGIPVPARMMALKEAGWSAVPAERHPEMSFHGVVEVGKDYATMKDFIWRRGLVLMERLKEIGEIEREIQEEENYSLMVNMQGTDNFLGDRNIPVVGMRNETSVSKGIHRDVAFGG